MNSTKTHKGKMKVKEVKGLECPHCASFITQDDLGVEFESAIVTLYQCSECNEVYEDKEEAKDCCKD